MVERLEKIRIVGVDCSTCIYSIKRGLEKLKCISRFDVDVTSGFSIISYDQEICSLHDIYRVIRESGYDVEKHTLVLQIDNLDDYGEEFVVNYINKLPGVLEARASSITKLVKIAYNQLSIDEKSILSFLEKRGFKCKPASVVNVSKLRLEKMLLFKRLLAFIIGASIVVSTITSDILRTSLPIAPVFVASTIVLVSISDVLIRGLKAFIFLKPTMESFITVSAIISYVTGLALLTGFIKSGIDIHIGTFFEASAGVAGFVSFGLYLEERLKNRAFKQVEELSKKLCGKARVLRNNGYFETEAINVKPGDVVEIRAGEIIPVDGIVIDGWGYVDESSFTGEPIPRLKKSEFRDHVLAGTILVSGFLRVRTTRSGSDTVISYIVETVREAQFFKPSAVKIADKIVGLFTWLVILVSLTTLFYWMFIRKSFELSILFAASVFAVACPCGLGIAIPLVSSFSIIKSSKMGLLIKRGDVFERVLNTKIILFDKTGTLTIGKPKVKSIHVINGNINDLLYYACSVESRSEHLIAKSILEYCIENRVNYDDVDYYEHIPGMGVIGRINNTNVIVGNLELVNSFEISASKDLEKLISDISIRGSTPVVVATSKEIIGVIELSDVLREEAVSVVKEIKRLGYSVGIVSGDHRNSVLYFAKALGIDNVYYELKPPDKEDLVKDLEAKGLKTMFVGDGVNDASALSRSTVGVAMGGGTDVAKKAGDVVLMRSKLNDLVVLINLSRVVRSKFKQNILWASIYNIVLIPIAAGLLYDSHGLMLKPEFAALAMILSDISVVLNASTVMFKNISLGK